MAKWRDKKRNAKTKNTAAAKYPEKTKTISKSANHCRSALRNRAAGGPTPFICKVRKNLKALETCGGGCIFHLSQPCLKYNAVQGQLTVPGLFPCMHSRETMLTMLWYVVLMSFGLVSASGHAVNGHWRIPQVLSGAVWTFFAIIIWTPHAKAHQWRCSNLPWLQNLKVLSWNAKLIGLKALATCLWRAVQQVIRTWRHALDLKRFVEHIMSQTVTSLANRPMKVPNAGPTGCLQTQSRQTLRLFSAVAATRCVWRLSRVDSPLLALCALNPSVQCTYPVRISGSTSRG